MRSVRFLSAAITFATVTATAATPVVGNDSYSLAKVPSQAPRTSAIHHDPFTAAFELASAAQRAKDFDRALALFRQAAALADLRSSPMSWLTTEFNICHTLNLQGKKTQAAAVARQIVRDCENFFGNADPLTSEALAHLAFVLKQHGRLADAEPIYRRNVRLLEAKYGNDNYLTANAICRHGSLLHSLGKLPEAEAQLRRALAIVIEATDGSGDPAEVCFFLTHLAYCLHARHKAEEAHELMDAAYSIVRQQDDATLAFAGGILRRQAEFYRDTHQYDRAEELAHRALLRLAVRDDTNRAKFFYYDMVADVYRSILSAKGADFREINAALQKVQEESGMPQTTVEITAPGVRNTDSAQ